MKSILTISAMCACFFIAGCHKEDETSNKLPDRIEVYPAEFKLGGDASRAQKDIRFETNAVSWKARSDQPWCTLSPDSGGRGLTVITLSGADNLSDTNRMATAYFYTDELTVTRPVVQRPKDAIVVTPNVLNFGWKADSADVTIETKALQLYEIEIFDRYINDEQYIPWVRTGGIPWMLETRCKIRVKVEENMY